MLVLSLVANTSDAFAKERREVLGIFENGKELGAIEVIIDNGVHRFPLEEFAGLIAAKVEPGEDGKTIFFATKIGRAKIDDKYLSEFDNMVFVSQKFLEERLSASVKFNVEEYALDLDLPWKAKGAAKAELSTVLEPVKPDVRPSKFGLSTIHGNSYFEMDDDLAAWFNTVKLTGHAMGGVWQLRYEDDIADNRRLRDFVWLKELEEGRWVQIGHQNISIHPLLKSVEMTGVQYAWTNAPREFSQQRFRPGEILNRHGRQQRNFRGRGPVGGIAEIWINDQKKATTTIDLNGEFEFGNITLGSRQSEIEIRTFDRHNPTTPVEVKRSRIALSDLMLAPGTVTALGGSGVGGNLLGNKLGDANFGGADDLVAFGLVRYGLTEDITLEAALETSNQRATAMLGAIGRVSENIVGAASVGIDDVGNLAYDLEADWKLNPLHITLRSIWRQENFGNDGRENYWDNRVNASYRYSDSLEFGVIARHDEDTSFALPYIYWHPMRKLSLRARPNNQGDYRYDARYKFSPDVWLNLSHDYQTNISFFSRLNDELNFIAGYRTGGNRLDRASVGLTGSALFNYDLSWRLAAIYQENKIGLEGYARAKIKPGVYGFVEASTTDSAFRNFTTGTSTSSRTDMRLRLGVSYDLAVSENGIGPATRGTVDPARGGVTGRIDAAGLANPNELKGIPILVDGREVTRTTEGGKFFIPALRKGIHAVEIDAGELPVELVTKKRSINAEVAPGALTSVTFSVEAEYGAAGQITDTGGEGLANLALAVVDGNGAEMARTKSNEFGYYRIDQLRPGSYHLKLIGEAGPEGKILKSFTIKNDYVFGVDIRLQ